MIYLSIALRIVKLIITCSEDSTHMAIGTGKEGKPAKYVQKRYCIAAATQTMTS